MKIADILNVYHLKSLSRLEELDLRGNAIATRPGYKETILLFLKNLRLLDGKTIKAADRLRIPQELSSQYSLLDRLLKNYSEILRLQSVKNFLSSQAHVILGYSKARYVQRTI